MNEIQATIENTQDTTKKREEVNILNLKTEEAPATQAPYKKYNVYLLRLCIAEVEATTKELAETWALEVGGVRDISTREQRRTFHFSIWNIKRECFQPFVMEKKRGVFKVLAPCIYVVQIATSENDYKKIAKMVELFTGEETDTSKEEDRKKWLFKIGDIEQIKNEVIRIDEV